MSASRSSLCSATYSCPEARPEYENYCIQNVPTSEEYLLIIKGVGETLRWWCALLFPAKISSPGGTTKFLWFHETRVRCAESSVCAYVNIRAWSCTSFTGSWARLTEKPCCHRNQVQEFTNQWRPSPYWVSCSVPICNLTTLNNTPHVYRHADFGRTGVTKAASRFQSLLSFHYCSNYVLKFSWLLGQRQRPSRSLHIRACPTPRSLLSLLELQVLPLYRLYPESLTAILNPHIRTLQLCKYIRFWICTYLVPEFWEFTLSKMSYPMDNGAWSALRNPFASQYLLANADASRNFAPTNLGYAPNIFRHPDQASKPSGYLSSEGKTRDDSKGKYLEFMLQHRSIDLRDSPPFEPVTSKARYNTHGVVKLSNVSLWSFSQISFPTPTVPSAWAYTSK